MRILTYSIALLALLVAVHNLYYFHASWPIRDFTAFYLSATDFWHDGFLYARPHPYINLNAPHVTVLLFSPFVVMPEPVAAVIWQVLSALCVGAALLIIREEVSIPRSRWSLFLALLAASCALQHQLRQAQVGGVLLLLGTLAWRAARHRQASLPWWLALTVTLKPWLVPVVLVEWRTALRTTAIGLTGVLLGVWLCGLPNWTAWFTTMGEHDVWPTPSNLGLFGAALRYSGQLKYGGEVESATFVRSVWLASSAVVFVGTTAVTWWQRPDTDRLWLLWILAALLISPISWTYYLLVLLGPLAAWGERRHWPMPARIAFGLWAVPVILVSAFWRAGSPFLGSIYTLGALLIWGSAAGADFDTRQA